MQRADQARFRHSDIIEMHFTERVLGQAVEAGDADACGLAVDQEQAEAFRLRAGRSGATGHQTLVGCRKEIDEHLAAVEHEGIALSTRRHLHGVGQKTRVTLGESPGHDAVAANERRQKHIGEFR